MILLFSLLLGVAMPRQQQTQPARTPRDSTMRVLVGVAGGVADVRADIDHYRTLVFNDTNDAGGLRMAGGALREACTQLTKAATDGRAAMCINCLIESLRPAFASYRNYLPSLATMGTRCAGRLAPSRLERAKPAELRTLVLELSDLIRNGLGPYEQRVAGVMSAIRAPARRTAPAPAARPSP